ncbi:hypothetical protein R6Q59_033514 [Mikania micrantha]|uniref:O-methyltransferase domain-containing protein n=1 Tax=Mikania micrantha TaxID=192012 RepID=A0A5N6NVH4_9ASTR|nr:hypothetical protein E3N88_18216 [Mikania micrantha]
MGSNEHFNYAMELVTITALPMVLMTIVKLKILETIAEAGSDAQLTAKEIASRLSITNEDAPDMVDRMLRLLTSYSVVTCSKAIHESIPVRVYGLTPVGKYFTPNEDGASLGDMMLFAQDKVYIESWFGLKDSVFEGGVAFNKIHKMHPFEYPAFDTRYNEVFNKAMKNHTIILMKEILEHYHGFNNLKSVIDVGGGLGININMIVTKYPSITGINFDLPHVTDHAPFYEGIKHVGGDMFKEIPQGDAIFMKWILHDWNDEHCVKLLKNCYKALPQDGKVIVVELILPFVPDTSSTTKYTTLLDAVMLAESPKGKERTEDEYLALAKSAGFTGLKKICYVCNFWVMEFYK